MSKESSTSSASTFRFGAYERHEMAEVSGPVRARVASRSGDVTIEVGSGREVEVTLSTNVERSRELLELAEIQIDAERGVLVVRTRHDDDALRGLKSAFKRGWFDLGNHDLDVHVVLPAGSSAEVSTVSGDTSVQGELNELRVDSASGDLVALERCRRLDFKTASGDAHVGDVTEVLKCRSASGDVVCGGAAATSELSSASGDVDVTAPRAGELSVKVVSGDVRVEVSRGLCVDINAGSVSGDVSSNIDLDGSSADEGETLVIKVSTVSGDVRVDRAP